MKVLEAQDNTAVVRYKLIESTNDGLILVGGANNSAIVINIANNGEEKWRYNNDRIIIVKNYDIFPYDTSYLLISDMIVIDTVNYKHLMKVNLVRLN